ncbi:unnamed protein product [Peronospora effusa]|nr:unnamed protein product [Peronospora effusa]
MVHLAPCSTKISGKEAALLFLDHVYRLRGMPESIVSDRDPRFTSGFWRHVFELLGSKLHMSTADHPQTDGQTERANRVVADVLRTIATPTEWSKQFPFVEFAINNSVHASTGETPFYINGLRHPRTPVSFVRSPSLSGGGPLTSLVDTAPIGVTEETRQELPVLLDDDTIVLSTASTHDRPLEGVIGELDAKRVSEAQRFVDERLAITRKVRDAMASAQDKQKQYADQHGRKNNEHFSVDDKVLLGTANLPKHAVSVLLVDHKRSHIRIFLLRSIDIDCESSVVADQTTGKVNNFPYTRPTTEYWVIEEDSALDAGLSSPVARVCPNGSSDGVTPDDPSYSPSLDPKSVARLDSRD